MKALVMERAEASNLRAEAGNNTRAEASKNSRGESSNTPRAKAGNNPQAQQQKSSVQIKAASKHRLKDFSRQVPVAKSNALCKDILELFQENASCECIVLEDAIGKVTSLAMRHRFSYKLAHRYSVALFYNKPAMELLDIEPVIVSVHMDPRELIELAMARTGDALYDCIVLTEGERCAGIMTVGDLLQLINALEQESNQSRIETVRSARLQLEGIAHDVSDVKKASEAGDTLSLEMVDLTLQGKNELDKVLSSFQKLEQSSVLQEERMKELQQEAGSIDSVSKLIKELAEQSNLLSINATIEAARAGEFGRGFSVVAAEFTKLAEQTKKSALQISRITEAILHSIDAASYQVGQGRELVASSSRFVEAANDVYQQIFKAAADNKTMIGAIGEQAAKAHAQALDVVERMNTLQQD